MRGVLLVVIQRSSDEVKKAALRGSPPRLLKRLEAWVAELLEQPHQPGNGGGNRAGGQDAASAAAAATLLAILSCLASLPMDLETLRRSGIGRVVGSLRKHASAGVVDAAHRLVEQWRALAAPPAAASAPEPSPTAAKKARTAAGGGRGGLKIDILDKGAGGGAAKAGGQLPSPGLSSPISPNSPTAAAALAAAAATECGQLQSVDSDEIMREVTRGSIRNSVPTVRKVRTSGRDQTDWEGSGRLSLHPGCVASRNVPMHPRTLIHIFSHTHSQVHTLQVIGFGSHKRPAPGADPTQTPAAATGDPPLGGQLPSSPAAGTPATGAAGGGRAGGLALAAPRARLGTLAGSFGAGVAAAGRLGSLRDASAAGGGGGGGVAGGVSGGAASSGSTTTTSISAARVAAMLSPVQSASPPPGGLGSYRGDGGGGMGTPASQRATAARSRIPTPEPEPEPRKPKLKTVSWAVETALEHSRWFKKVGSPV